MTRKTVENISRLPKWAQFLISKLQADGELYKGIAHSVQTGKSRVWVDSGPLTEPRYLPDGDAITFKLTNGRLVRVRLVEGGLSLNTDFGILVIVPSANNEATVKSVDSRFNWED